MRARGRKMPPARGRAGGATTRGGRETHPLRVPRRLSVSAMFSELVTRCDGNGVRRKRASDGRRRRLKTDPIAVGFLRNRHALRASF